MPRQCKRRRICSMPRCERFGPYEAEERDKKNVIMGLDEFETIRLIDLNGLTQEQCARQMNVARTTVQAIYSSARYKLAQCLVNGMQMQIEGGDYELCDGDSKRCGHSHCIERCTIKDNLKELDKMKIAVTYENGQVFQHFGHTQQFKIYDVEDGKVTSSRILDTNGSGHGALAGLLGEEHINVLICGGIGGGAQNALAEAGIQLYGGTSGDTDKVVQSFLDNNLDFDPDVHCDHHGEEHHGSCGEHGCGEHHCS